MSDPNVFVFGGRLGRDIELQMNNDQSVTGVFSVANSVYAGSPGGAARYETGWFECRWRSHRAERLQEELVKGRAVIVTGALRFYLTETGKNQGLPPRLYVDVIDVSLQHEGRGSDSRPEGRSSHAAAPQTQQRAAPPPRQAQRPQPSGQGRDDRPEPPVPSAPDQGEDDWSLSHLK